MDSHTLRDQEIDVPQWTVEAVLNWLAEHGLEEHLSTFKEHLIDGETLLSLNERMIDKLFPIIKTQVKFTKLLNTLKGKDQDVPKFTRSSSAQEMAPLAWPPVFQLPAFPTLLKRKLAEESADFHTPAYRSKWRSQIIQVLFDTICMYTWYPTSRQYHDVCASLVSKHPCLRDKNGQGYESWLGMLKNKFKKERIPLVNPDVEYHRTKHGKKRLSSAEDNSALQPQKKATSRWPDSPNLYLTSKSEFPSHPQLDVEGDQEDISAVNIHAVEAVASSAPQRSTPCSGKGNNESKKTKAVPGKDGAHAHMPTSSDTNVTEDCYSVKMHISKMKEECKKACPNMSILKEKMRRTYEERMRFIATHSTRAILDEFPALQHANIIFSEMERIYGVDVDKRLLEGFGKAASKILVEAERRNLGKEIRLQYQRALSQECEATHKAHSITAAMFLLPYLFNEHPDKLYVADKEVKAPTPVLMMSGNPFSVECEIVLQLDGADILRPEDISQGVGALLGIYFIFGVQYPANLKKTLMFMQKCMFGIQSKEKFPIAVIKMANFLL